LPFRCSILQKATPSIISMSETYAVEINGLSKDYETGFWKKKRVRALDDLTLNVPQGRIFGFLGGKWVSRRINGA